MIIKYVIIFIIMRMHGSSLLRTLGFEQIKPHSTSLALLWEASLAGRRCLISLELASVGGKRNLEAAFSRGVLRCQAARQELIDPDPRRTCVVIVAPSLSKTTEQAVARFAETTSGGITWMVTDGTRLLAPRAGQARRLKADQRKAPSQVKRVTVSSGFSDRFLACAKALALTDAPGAGAFEYTSTPSGERSDIEDLALRSATSVPHVYRFLKTYRRMGFVERASDGIHLIRRRGLFDAWSLRAAQQFEKPIRGAIPLSQHEQWLKHKPSSADSSTFRCALGGHAAAAQFGADEVAYAPILIYVDGDPYAVAEVLGINLSPDFASTGNVELIRPAFPAATWRGVLQSDSGWEFTDAIQCYIDLLRHPRRGADAAGALRDVFPSLLGEGDESP